MILVWFGSTPAIQTFCPRPADVVTEKFCWNQFDELTGLGAHCVTQDSSGRLWFGLEDGIMQYDGLNWRRFTGDDGLPASFIQSLTTAPGGRVVAVYERHGVYVRHEEKWRRLPSLQPDSSVIFYDAHFVGPDSLWIATNKGAVFKTAKKLQLFTPDAVYHLNKHPPKDAPAWHVYRIYQDRTANLWFVDISEPNARLFRVSDWRRTLYDFSAWEQYTGPPDGSVLGTRTQIYQASDGRYYLYSYNETSGIYSFRSPRQAWQYFNLTEYGGNNLALSVLETPDKTLWFGGNGYLYRLFDTDITVYNLTELNVQIAPIELFQTRDGGMWLLGLNAELYRIDYARRTWNIFPDLHYQCDTRDGAKYFLSADGAVIVRQPDGPWLQYNAADGLMNMPSTVLSTSNDEIWAAGSHNGIAAVSRLEGTRWTTETFPQLSWSVSYLSAMQSYDGRLWFGSMGDPTQDFLGGCIVYEKDDTGTYQWRHLISETESFNRIGSLTQTADSTIWAGGSHLLYFENGQFKMDPGLQELEKGWIDHISGTTGGDLFVAKGGVGVFQKSGKQWQKYTLEDNLAGSMTTHILETDRRDILVATQRGISKFDGETWNRHHFPREINIKRESGTLKQSSDGKIWINLAPRAWYFRAAYQPTEDAPSYPGFRTISYAADSLAPTSDITFFQQQLTQPSNQFITWTGNDYWGHTDADQLTYSYRLNDGGWSTYSSQRSAQFLNMDAGDYTFELRSRDRDGNSQRHPSTAQFRVLPVVWKQPWFLILISVLGSAILFLFVSLLINNRKLAHANREIEKIASFKERFFLNVSHELRTPLTLILSPLSKLLAAPESLPKPAKKQLTVMRHHAHYLRQVVNQLLNFRKLENDSARLHLEHMDIAGFCRNIKSLFDGLADSHQIEFSFHAEPGRLYGWIDAQKLETILMNLIGNAFKFTPDGGAIDLTITGKPTQPHREPDSGADPSAATYEEIEIRVKDSGIGIPPDRLKHIFDRFYHVDHPGALFYDSIGIGLDFTKEIVEMHRGHISASSTPGNGAEFTVVLPVAETSYETDEKPIDSKELPERLTDEHLEDIQEGRDMRNDAAQRRAAAPTPTLKDGRATLLIVEDHPDMRHMLADFFNEDYDVLQAPDGRAGLEQAQRQVPDLIISDVMMPNMDGIVFTRKLKSNIFTSHIPVILLTVKNEHEHRIEGLETGADAYVNKPFEFEELAVRVRKLIETRELLKTRFQTSMELEPSDIQEPSLDEEFLQACIRSVENHFSESFQVDELCKEIGMSRTQAYRKLKSLTGFSINEFIMHIKMKRAVQLLRRTEKNISEIAYSLGFSDHAHFTRQFRRQFNCTPKEYRKQKTVR